MPKSMIQQFQNTDSSANRTPPDPPTVHSHSPWHNREHWDMTLQVKDPRALVAAQDIAALVARSAVIIVGIHRLYR